MPAGGNFAAFRGLEKGHAAKCERYKRKKAMLGTWTYHIVTYYIVLILSN